LRIFCLIGFLSRFRHDALHKKVVTEDPFKATRMPFSSYRLVRQLSQKSRVALIAPAGPLQSSGDLERAISNVHLFGWEPVVGKHVSARFGYLAGTDAERLADLNWALQDTNIDGVWCMRGGYGVMRLLDAIDYDALRVQPKPIIGYSDITALLAAIGRMCSIVTYHGPTARGELTAFSRNSFERALLFGEDSGGTAHGARTIRGGRVVGRLMGGNLALVSALVGTSYMPDLRGAILVLEDVNEPVYRIDRMLRQLLLAGALDGIVAIAFGQSTGETGADLSSEGIVNGGGRRTLDDVLHELAQVLNIPCVVGLPVGHIDEQWTLPLGALAQLDADATTLHIISTDHS
jgi:muramoyltetrapeptide carboxypeptidase